MVSTTRKRPSTANSTKSDSPRSASSSLPLVTPARPPLSPKLSAVAAPAVVMPKPVVRVPPKVGFVGKWHLWVEGTFAYSMLELWEKVLLNSVGLGLLALLYFAVTSYLPTKLHLLAERIHWYIYGSDSDIPAVY